MPTGSEHDGRPEIIHAVHGVTSEGSWFLLADISPNVSADRWHPCDGDRTPGDAWLVVLGRRERDIINLRDLNA